MKNQKCGRSELKLIPKIALRASMLPFDDFVIKLSFILLRFAVSTRFTNQLSSVRKVSMESEENRFVMLLDFDSTED